MEGHDDFDELTPKRIIMTCPSVHLDTARSSDRLSCYRRSTWSCSSCYYCCYYFCVILLIYSCNFSSIYTSDTPDLAVTIALHGCCCS